jgi:predicted acylesterase/phospholipase RssA
MCKPAGKDAVIDLLRKRPSCRKHGSSNPTFRILKEETDKDLFVTAMRVRDGKLVSLGAEEATMDVLIHKVVTASCSISFLNPAIELNGELYLNGVLGVDLPMRAFEHIEDKQTVMGLMICNAKPRETSHTFGEYINSVKNVVLERLSEPQRAWESNRAIHYDANELAVFESPNAGLADIMFYRRRNILKRWGA